MKKTFAVIGYIWAGICVLLIPASYLERSYFAEQFSRLSFMKINPKFTGGDFARSYQQDSLTITINKPVFPALIGQGKKGYVQIRFDGMNKLPPMIHQKIDYNDDGKEDFLIDINTSTGETKLEPLSVCVTGVDNTSPVKKGWVVRVSIVNGE